MAVIAVVGSINIDFVIYLERFPRVDETVSDGVYEIHFGGKGANQAVGLSRLGCKVYMIGKVGMDSLGDMAIENLRRNGVNVDHVRRDRETHTGTAFILVNREGNTMISVAPGANRLLNPVEAEESLRAIGRVDVVLAQLEIPMETVERVSRVSEEIGAKFILTPAPAKKIPDEVLKRTHTIIPNRTEIFRILGREPRGQLEEEIENAARELVIKGVENVVVTLGEHGAALYSRGMDRVSMIPAAKPERVVDTTGAGDAFTACYSYGIASGMSVIDSVRLGSICASIKISRRGAQEGLPRLEEVLKKLGSS